MANMTETRREFIEHLPLLIPRKNALNPHDGCFSSFFQHFAHGSSVIFFTSLSTSFAAVFCLFAESSRIIRHKCDQLNLLHSV